MSLLESSQILGNLGEFFGAIFIVITLLYLAKQIQENTKSNLVMTRQHFAAQAAEIIDD